MHMQGNDRAAVEKAAKAAAKAAKRLAKELLKAAIEALQALVAAVGVWGAVIIIIVIIVAVILFVVLSPFGIFTGGGADNTPTIPAVVQTLNGELSDRIAQIQKSAGVVDKVNISFNGNDDNSSIDNWPDILAVFAVETNMSANNPMDVVEMDTQRISMLRKVFWDMTIVTYDITDESPAATASPSPDSTSAPASTPAAPKQILTINVLSRYWDDMATDYNFGDAQVKMLQTLMSAKYYSLLAQLASTIVPGSPATDWSGVIDVPEGGMDIPLYLQSDYRQTVCYISGVAKSVASSGCGAASTSMVIAYLTGDTNQTPYTLFKWAYDHGEYTGDGLGHSCLTKMASLYGVKGTWIANNAALITAALQAGHPVIAHMGPGIFTNDGHYIVLRGVTDDGHVLVNDPGSRRRNRYAYLLSTVVAQARTSDSFMVCEVK